MPFLVCIPLQAAKKPAKQPVASATEQRQESLFTQRTLPSASLSIEDGVSERKTRWIFVISHRKREEELTDSEGMRGKDRVPSTFPRFLRQLQIPQREKGDKGGRAIKRVPSHRVSIVMNHTR